MKKAPALAGAWPRGAGLLFADLRGIAESDGKEEGRDGQSQDQDVREAFHEFPLGVWRSAEGRTSWGHEALRQAAGGAVAQFLEQTEFHLFAQIWIDTCEHISVEGAGTVPDVAEE